MPPDCGTDAVPTASSSAQQVICMMWHRLAWWGMAWHSMAWHALAQLIMAHYSSAWHRMAQHSPVPVEHQLLQLVQVASDVLQGHVRDTRAPGEIETAKLP